MKTLLVLRHAKSSWKQAGQTDHDRPLNPRGTRDAPRMGALMCDRRLAPDLIISSSAVRALRTAEEVADACGFEWQVRSERRLYLADPDTILEVLGEVAGDVRRLLIVGHNPGLEGLVMVLTGRDETMPTAALAEISLSIDDWNQIGSGTRGELVEIWRPKEVFA